MCIRGFFSRLTRKKSQGTWLLESPLRKCHTLLDLTSFGVGAITQAGLYVMVGQLAHDVAGPSLIIAILTGAVAASLAALCFSEFASQIPMAGSAYSYTYSSMGEIWAFMVGWSLILRYVIDAAIIARSCSIYINSLSRGAIYDFFTNEEANWHESNTGAYPDFLALAITVTVLGIVCLGVKYSRKVTNCVTALNVTVVLFIVVSSLPFLDCSNWSTADKFAPYGVVGVLQATTKCFYCFAGFDCILTASKETLDPKRTIPRGIFLAIGIGLLAYLSVSSVLTLMVPYDSRNSSVNLMVEAFASKGFHPARYIISVGALCAMLGGLFSRVFSASRILYCMSCDRLMFCVFTKVHKRTRVPLPAVMCCGFIIVMLALFLKITELVELISLCCLLSYTMVAVSVMLNRCEPSNPAAKSNSNTEQDQEQENAQNHGKKNQVADLDLSTTFLEKFVPEGDLDKDLVDVYPATTDSNTPKSPKLRCRTFVKRNLVGVLVLALIGLCVVLRSNWWYTPLNKVLAIQLTAALSVIALVCLLKLQQQLSTRTRFPFMVPAIPYVPALSMFINLFLIAGLPYSSYITLTTWTVCGMYHT